MSNVVTTGLNVLNIRKYFLCLPIEWSSYVHRAESHDADPKFRVPFMGWISFFRMLIGVYTILGREQSERTPKGFISTLLAI